MTFVQPLLLLALLTLPLIVLIHLLRERRRRVSVPSLLHWRNLPRRPDGERIRRLPLTLLLLLQLLIAALLGLALGRPQILGGPGGASRQLIIILDTSTSMAARDGATTRFEQAQARARALLGGLRAGDRATLIAAGSTARVAAGAGSDLPAVGAALDGLRPGGTGTDLDGALTLAEAELDPQREQRIVVISDGALPPLAPRRVAAPLDWQPVGAAQPNRAIITFATRLWGGKLQAYARAANYDSAPFSGALRLYADDQLIDTRDLTIAADGETELTWTLPGGHTTLRAELDGRDGLPQDDQAFLAVPAPRPISAVLVSSQSDSLRRALAAVPGVSVEVVEPASYPGAVRGTPDLTVFDGFLPQAWPPGAVLAINPPPDRPALLAVGPRPRLPAGGELAQNSALLAGLNLGGVNFGSIQPVTPPAWAETQLALGDQPLILRGRSGTNEIAIWTFNLAGGDLPTRLAFPLLVARTVRDLEPAPLPPSIQAGDALPLRPDPRAATVLLTGPDGAATRVAAAPLLALDPLDQLGFYRVEERSGDSSLFSGLVGVNAGAAIESDVRPRPAPQLAGVAQGQAGGSGAQRSVTDLWPWLALGALALLMLEWGYIHR